MKFCGSKLFIKAMIFSGNKKGKRGKKAVLCAFLVLFAFFASLSPSIKESLCVAAQSAQQSREFHETYDLPQDGVVTIDNTNGYIRVTSWNENRVKVDAVKRARRNEDPGQVEIQVTPRPGRPQRLEIRTIYPRSESSVSVDYDLKVPRGATVNAQSTNGEITITDPVASVTARSNNGVVTVRQVTGDATLSSDNGRVVAERMGGALTVMSANGNVTIGDVASTLNARCNNCNVSARGVRDDATIRTANGSIELERVGGRVTAEAANGRISINDVGGDVNATSFSSITVINARGYVMATANNGSATVRGAGEGARASSVGGSVEISDSKGRIEAIATNGPITLRNIDGKDVSARSSNGPVVFSGRFQESGRYVFFSANGNVLLTLPPESNFNLTIRSDNGAINTEFPLKLAPGAVLGGRGPIIGTVGKGGAEVRAISNNGRVDLKKAPG
jgi:DUF4097 and DUF4098 domain-containing protein YvlB